MPQGVSFRRARFPCDVVPPPPGAPVLTEATYQASTWVELTFDRAIDIAGIVVNQINVSDGAITGQIWQGTGTATLIGANAVRVNLAQLVGTSGPTQLYAAAACNIVNAGDATPWAGANGVALPYP